MNNPVNSTFTSHSGQPSVHQQLSRNSNSHNTLDAPTLHSYFSGSTSESDSRSVYSSQLRTMEREKIYHNPKALLEFSRNAVVVDHHSENGREVDEDRYTPILDDRKTREERERSPSSSPPINTVGSTSSPNNSLSIAIVDDDDKNSETSPELSVPFSHQSKS